MPGLTSSQDRLHGLSIATVAAFTFLMALQQVYNYDLWWHLKVGEYIVQTLTVPTRDVFSFSTPDAPWVNLYWLSDPLFYLVHDAFGINGLLLFKCAVLAFAAALLYRLVARGGVHPVLAAALVVLVVDLSRFRFMLRPQMFQFLGVVLLLWLLLSLERTRWKYPLFFALTAVWAGLHSSAFLAQVLVGLLLAEWLIDRLFRRAGPGPDLRTLLTLFGLSLVALLCTPNGINLYKMVYGHIFSDVVTGTYVGVEEHKPLVVRENLAFLLFVLGTGVTFLTRAGRANARPFTLLLYLAFAVLAFGSVRYVALASFVMAAVAGVNLARPGVVATTSFRFGVAIWAGLAVACVGLWTQTFAAGKVYEFGLGINQSRFPFAAIERLRELGVTGNIYNSWRFGGFLQWHLPGSRTFIDGRCLDQQLQLYDRFTRIDLHGFGRYMAEHDVRAALVDRRNQRDVDYFNQIPGYRLVQMDDLSVLFVRAELLKGAASSGPAAYKYLRLGGYEYRYLDALARGPEAAAVETELLAAVAAAPESFFVRFQLAYFYDQRGDQRAAQEYQAAAAQNPQFGQTHFNIGGRGAMAALRAGQWELAETLAGQALEIQETAELHFLLGAARYKLGQLDAAIASYRASLALQESGQVLNNLGFAQLDAGQHAAARQSFEALLQQGDRHAESALYGLVLAHRGLGEADRAEASLAELRRRFPASTYLPALQAP